MNYISRKKLVSADELKNKYPLTSSATESRDTFISDLKSILSGKDDRFIVIIGPCSADNEATLLDYAERLMRLYEQVRERLLIIPRVYTAKPRTSAGTYKGMLHNPVPTGEENITLGLECSRRLHTRVLNDTGLATADEILYPEVYEYFDDCLCYGAIGARSSENQFYRLFSSAMEIPVGIKNPTSGSIPDMINACECSQQGGGFIFNGEVLEARGNDYAHCILRGGSNENYSFEKLLEASRLLFQRKILNPSLIIDTNHGNSGKDHTKESAVALSVLESRNKDKLIKSCVKGLMIESYISEGCQDISGNVYGKSVTDPCIGWEETYKLVNKIAELK